MKTFFITWFTFLSSLLLGATSDTIPRFYYVVENPKYFGDSVCAWFEIAGIHNEIVQNKINDTLRKIYNVKIGFHKRHPNEIEYAHTDHAPEGFTDYSYGYPYSLEIHQLRLKDSDSICYLSLEDCRWGCNESLIGFEMNIASGKMAHLRLVNYNSSPLVAVKSYTFSLITGQLMPQQFYISIIPSKRNEMMDKLYYQASYSLNNMTIPEYRNTRINRDSSDINLDSIPIASQTLITVLNGGGNGYYDPYMIWCNFKVLPTSKSTFKGTATISTGLWPKDAIPFFEPKEWQALLHVYEN